ncbi:MAG: glycoside hydrolase family 3 protein [Bacteroidaceae bacterium]|nr:glycoside hydrolase family 3 protein [Bacteroidaceae bacterium]
MRRLFTLLMAVCIGNQIMAQDVTLREDNIDVVLGELTLKEKASLVVGAGYKSMVAGVFDFKVPVPGAAGMTREVPRLGIPAIVLSDGPAGVRIKKTCTGFPIGSMLSSTWNTELVERVGEAIGDEALQYGVDVMLAPGMNLQRNPLCGRNFEYFSEDPLLSGKVAAAYVRGVQSRGVGTSVKHFAANNQETNRMDNDSQVAEDVLRGLYLKGFEIAVKESQPWTVMASYNRLNGVYTQEDPWLLTEVLRNEWGFQGLVMTDWTGRRNTAAQISAGCDLMEPGSGSQINELVKKVEKGELSEEALDVCVRRVLELVVKTPTFKGTPRSDKPNLKAHAQVALEAAEEGIVLLKNEAGTLPLKSSAGSSTSQTQSTPSVALFGVGSYELLAGGTGSGHVHRPYVIGLEEGLKDRGVTVEPELSYVYHKYLQKHRPRKTLMSGMLGSPAAPEMPISRSTVEAAAQLADVAILTISRQAGEGGDRHLEDDFHLTNAEKQMLLDISYVFHAQGKKFIVVLNIGGVIETASWKHLADAILLAWQPGQEGGHALASILLGNTNPSARLPITFPADYFDLPSSANFPYDYHGKSSMSPFGPNSHSTEPNVGYTKYEEGMAVGYRAYFESDKKPSYPFGFGLSYTQFEESEPSYNGNIVTVTVTNVGSVAGKHVVLLMDLVLRAFGKTRLLAPGESQTLKLDIIP